jgi:hypothetical protein
MEAFAYSNSPWPIRSDLRDAFRFTWKKVSEPGTWLTGAERVAIASEVRNAQKCDLCSKRKKSLSPFLPGGKSAGGESAEGEHHGSHGPLSSTQVDVAHRLTTDASRLTESWLDQCVAAGVSREMYVEILSVVVSTLAIDSFHHCLGFELEPLPEAREGEPSLYRPLEAKGGPAWVPMVDVKEVAESDADIYEGMDRNANVISAMSLVPDAVRLLKVQSAAMYLEMNEVANPASNGGRTLSRPQIELIAGRVSALNDCFY